MTILSKTYTAQLVQDACRLTQTDYNEFSKLTIHISARERVVSIRVEWLKNGIRGENQTARADVFETVSKNITNAFQLPDENITNLMLTVDNIDKIIRVTFECIALENNTDLATILNEVI